MIFASASLITLVPRFWRMYLAEWLIKRCRLPATPAFTRPDAVILKRFLAPDLVFIFGILRTLIGSRRSAHSGLPRHAIWPGGPFGRRLYREKALSAQGLSSHAGNRLGPPRT